MATIGDALATLRDEIRDTLGDAAGTGAPWELLETLVEAGGALQGILAGDSDEPHTAGTLIGTMSQAKEALRAYHHWSSAETIHWS